MVFLSGDRDIYALRAEVIALSEPRQARQIIHSSTVTLGNLILLPVSAGTTRSTSQAATQDLPAILIAIDCTERPLTRTAKLLLSHCCSVAVETLPAPQKGTTTGKGLVAAQSQECQLRPVQHAASCTLKRSRVIEVVGNLQVTRPYARKPQHGHGSRLQCKKC